MSPRAATVALTAALTAALALARPGRAGADDTPTTTMSWLGPPRRIPRAWSASRDTPTMNLLVVPRDVRTAGGELALATIPFATFTLRAGFAGLLELESDGETEKVGNLFPAASGAILWRGAYAYHVAFSLDALAARWCPDSALELTVQYRHESQHYTGSNHGGAGMDVRHQPFIGDDVIVDAAASQRRGRWRLAARASAMIFLPDRSSYAGGPALDLHARWAGRARVHPFVSLYGEYLIGDELMGRRFPDAYLARAMGGAALPSSIGDLLLYLAADVGHRKGIRGLTEEATVSVGIRLALFASP